MRLALVALVLSSCGQQMMSKDAGSDEFACAPNTGEVTLGGRVQLELFDRQCKSCHNAFDATNGDYSDAARTAAAVAKPSQYSAALKPVVANDLSKSTLWRKMNGLKGPGGEALGGVMPPGGMLGATSLQLVRDWICTGAK
jgi:hypothetical protein